MSLFRLSKTATQKTLPALFRNTTPAFTVATRYTPSKPLFAVPTAIPSASMSTTSKTTPAAGKDKATDDAVAAQKGNAPNFGGNPEKTNATSEEKDLLDDILQLCELKTGEVLFSPMQSTV